MLIDYFLMQSAYMPGVVCLDAIRRITGKRVLWKSNKAYRDKPICIELVGGTEDDVRALNKAGICVAKASDGTGSA
jgi:3-hydroxymyristoyl/3-hydroxydecanoyl-(acyl carrier protein) dehydratase